jgi:hypothetical protein
MARDGKIKGVTKKERGIFFVTVLMGLLIGVLGNMLIYLTFKVIEVYYNMPKEGYLILFVVAWVVFLLIIRDLGHKIERLQN